MRALARALDSARMVRYNEGRRVLVVWYGGRALHVVGLDGVFIEVVNASITDSIEAFANTVRVFKDGWY